MSSLSFKQKEPILQIDQNQVQKFYQQRQLIKKKMLSPLNTQKNSNQIQPAFKNLFRRKSLANKIKQNSSVFDSLNDSTNEIQKLMSNSLINNHQSFSKLNQSCQSIDVLRQNKQINFPKKFNYFQSYNEESIVNESADIGVQFSQRQMKKRCNSVQLQNSSYSLRNHSRNSLQNLKPIKQTVPLSSILRKYQQEVNKIQKEGIQFNNYKNNQKNKKKISMFIDQQNKQNDNHFQVEPKMNEQKNLISQQKLLINDSIKLPQVVEKCIDKWKKLQIQQLKAEKESKIQNSKQQIKSIQNNPINFYMTQNYREPSQQNDEFQRLKLQYEQKLRQQQEKIEYLEKQNSHYKKFVTSIQKMKTILQKVENNDIKFDQKRNNFQAQLSPKKYQNKTKQIQQENDVNLKQLWRWIKSLPSSKFSSKKIQGSIR